MIKVHRYSTLFFLFVSTFLIGQVDTSAYQPEVLLILKQHADASKSGKTIYPLSYPQGEEFLFYVYDPVMHSNDIWCSNGSKESTRLIGSIWGREDLRLLGMVGDNYALRMGLDIWLMNISTKNIRLLVLKNEHQQEFSLQDVIIRNNHLFFYDDGLYCSGGTQASTYKVLDSATGEEPGMFGGLGEECELKGIWIFRAYDGKLKNKIWVFDGTREGTHALNLPPVEALHGEMQFHGPSYLIGSNRRAIISDENGFLFDTDGTDKGTYLLPLRMHNANSKLFDVDFSMYQDEFYWADRESSSIWKIDTLSRTPVQVCEHDSISLRGDFVEMEGRGYWISNPFRSDPFGKKIDLISCEVTDDCEDNDCMNDLFYLIQDHGNVCAYYRKPGKNKVPLPVFEQITKYEKYDNKPHCIYGSLEYLAPGLFEVDVRAYDVSWIVDLNKNAIRPIHFKGSYFMRKPRLYVLGDNIYFFDESKGSITLKVVRR